jgi:hypothetical protein
MFCLILFVELLFWCFGETFTSIVENHKVVDPARFHLVPNLDSNVSFIKDLGELILKGVSFNDLLESYTELQGVQLGTKKYEEGE